MKYKSEPAQSAKSKRVYYSAYSKYITDFRGCQEKFAEICVFAKNLRRRSVVSRPAPRINLRFPTNKVKFLLTNGYRLCIIYVYLKGDKSNMENAIVYFLIAVFMYAFLSAIIPLLWAESPLMFISCVVGGILIQYFNEKKGL